MHTNVIIGDIVNIANIDWVVLNVTEDGIHCATKDVIDYGIFDKGHNDYKVSAIRAKLHEFFIEIASKIGGQYILSHTTDLTAHSRCDWLLDMDDVNARIRNTGNVQSRIGLLTYDMFNEYKYVLWPYIRGQYNWWWLANPWMQIDFPIEENNLVCCVNGDLEVNHSWCFDDSIGIRPFCVFSHSLFK